VSDSRCPTLAQLEHIALASNDVERLLDFYLLLGGVALPLCGDPDLSRRGVVLDFWGVRVELHERRDRGVGRAGTGCSTAILHLGFALGSADAVDEITDVLAGASYRVLEPPRRTCELGCYESVVLDPDGHRVKLTV
jgi:lactoylglutathione lyase